MGPVSRETGRVDQVLVVAAVKDVWRISAGVSRETGVRAAAPLRELD